MKKIFVCAICGSYTIKNEHCGKNTKTAHPPPFNPNDQYGGYRRKSKGIE